MATSPPTREARAWNQRKDESVPAYAAFMQYLMLGDNRSCRRVAEVLGKSEPLMQRWSRKHEWQVRTAAYEEHYSFRALDMVEDERIALTREHLAFSTEVLKRARARLEYAVEKMPETTGDPEKDREIWAELEEQGRLITIDQAIRAGDLAVKVGRLATGLDGKYTPPGGGSTDLSGLNQEDLDEMEALLEKAKR